MGMSALHSYQMYEYPHAGEVSTLHELDAFLARVGSFHDGVVKEIHWVNGDCVDERLDLKTQQHSCARLLVQRQWDDPSAVEIKLYGVGWMHVDARECVIESGCKASKEGLLLLEIERSEFAFKRMSYRFESSWMGDSVRLGESWVEEPTTSTVG